MFSKNTRNPKIWHQMKSISKSQKEQRLKTKNSKKDFAPKLNTQSETFRRFKF